MIYNILYLLTRNEILTTLAIAKYIPTALKTAAIILNSTLRSYQEAVLWIFHGILIYVV